MSNFKKNDLYDREKKLHRVEKKNKNNLDKHKKIIYNVVPALKDEDTIDEYLDYVYTKQNFKRR
jgi:hypothetical protein